jgi:hypothetical protein
MKFSARADRYTRSLPGPPRPAPPASGSPVGAGTNVSRASGTQEGTRGGRRRRLALDYPACSNPVAGGFAAADARRVGGRRGSCQARACRQPAQAAAVRPFTVLASPVPVASGATVAAGASAVVVVAGWGVSRRQAPGRLRPRVGGDHPRYQPGRYLHVHRRGGERGRAGCRGGGPGCCRPGLRPRRAGSPCAPTGAGGSWSRGPPPRPMVRGSPAIP